MGSPGAASLRLSGGPDFVFEERLSDATVVQKVWRNESGPVRSFLSVARPHWLMVFARREGYTRVTVRGPETRATLAECPEDEEFLGILFKVGTSMPTLPARSLVDRDRVLPMSGTDSFWLNGSKWRVPDFENVDTFVAGLVSEGLIRADPAVTAALEDTSPAISPRSLQRRFVESTGLSQSAVRQMFRAQETLRMFRAGASIGEAVEEAGYFDQPHLTRSFGRYVGQTPAELLRSPPALSIF